MAKDYSLWLFQPNFPLPVIATILYGTVFLALFYLTLIKFRAWYFASVVFGAGMEVAGYALRAYSVKNQKEIAPFIITIVFIVLAPIFLAAGDYLLLGRLMRVVLPKDHQKIYGVPGRLLTLIFLVFDFGSFSIQGTGSQLLNTQPKTEAKDRIGTYVMVGGLSLQVLAFSVYLSILRRFNILANEMEADDAPRGWRKVMRAVYISSALIMIRSIYRVAEFAEGVHGYAYLHEWLFWVFEAVPMLVAFGIFCLYYPSKYLDRNGDPYPPREGDSTSAEIPLRSRFQRQHSST